MTSRPAEHPGSCCGQWGHNDDQDSLFIAGQHRFDAQMESIDLWKLTHPSTMLHMQIAIALYIFFKSFKLLLYNMLPHALNIQ